MSELTKAVSVSEKPISHKRKGVLTPAVTYPVVTVIILLAIWEIFGRLGMIDTFMFNWPSNILASMAEFILSGAVFSHLLTSFIELSIGFAMALIGIPIGLSLGYWKKLDYAFDPIIIALYTTPVIALTPLFILWFGLGLFSKIMMVFTMSIFPILINTTAGVKTTDASLIKAAKSYGATELQMFKEVIFPSSLSYIVTGIRLAIGRAMIAVVVAEMLASTQGIGYAIRHASEMFKTGEYLGYVAVLMIISVMLNQLLKLLERKIAPWRNI